MEKEFKVLNLVLSADQITGEESLLAILSEIENYEIEGLDFIPEMFDPYGVYFVIPKNSITASYLMNTPEDRKFLDMSNFIESTINMNNKVEIAFYEIDES